MLNRILLTALILFSGNALLAENNSRLNLLSEWMQGHFTSELQSQEDADFFKIHLNMISIWPSEKGLWLYVEQATATHLDKPYRQRVYQLIAVSETEFVSKVYTFENDKAFAGAYTKDAPLSDLKVEQLQERKGCAVYLRWIEDKQIFSGATKNRECESNLRGASFATSEVTISSQQILSWDRGFDDQGNQVWGAEKSGYQFLRQK